MALGGLRRRTRNRRLERSVGRLRHRQNHLALADPSDPVGDVGARSNAAGRPHSPHYYHAMQKLVVEDRRSIAAFRGRSSFVFVVTASAANSSYAAVFSLSGVDIVQPLSLARTG